MTIISIITPWLNGLHLLPDYARAVEGANQVIIVDNGSEPVTAQGLREYANASGATVIRNDTNLGFAFANNQGYAAATGEIVIFLNSDVAIEAPWLDLVRRDVQPGALSGPSLQRQLVYGMWLPYVEGWCIAGRRAAWEALNYWPTPLAFNDGPWDAAAYPGPYWEDNDLCLRALESGLNLAQTAWPVRHKGGQSAGALVNHGATFEANRATFKQRARALWERKTAPARLEGVTW